MDIRRGDGDQDVVERHRLAGVIIRVSPERRGASTARRQDEAAVKAQSVEDLNALLTSARGR